MTAANAPKTNEDGTISAIIAGEPTPFGSDSLIALDLPEGLSAQGIAGRYLLVRCGAQSEFERAENWQTYLRRPLFASGLRTHRQQPGRERWDFLLPFSRDPGYRWLATLKSGARLNVLGPLGRPFHLDKLSRNLLLAGSGAQLAALLPMIDQMLDRNGRVLVLLATEPDQQHDWISQLPLAVEVRLAESGAVWWQQLAEALPWADQLCATLPVASVSQLHDLIRQKRFRLEAGFAQVLAPADLVCGVGACLACVTPRRNGGYTRACIHGPAFDLTHLAA